MTDDERNSFENLMLLCPNHHREIDRLRPEEFTVDRLVKMKELHESSVADSSRWADSATVDRFVQLCLSAGVVSVIPDISEAAFTPGRIGNSGQRPSGDEADQHLVLINAEDGDLWIRNDGGTDAREPQVDVVRGERNQVWLSKARPGVLSPGDTWKAGAVVSRDPEASPLVVRVRWRNAQDVDFASEFTVGST